MDLYVNFEIAGKYRKIAEEMLKGVKIAYYPDNLDADIVLVRNNINIGKNTKMIQTISAGVDHLDIRKIPKNIVLCSNAGAYSKSVAEHTFALILSGAKNVIENDRNMKAGKFIQNPTILLNSKVIGIIGYGGIGREIARISHAFGMKVISFGRNSGDENADEYYTDIYPLLDKSDILVLSLPLTEKTKGIIDYEKLKGIKKAKMLVNIARYGLVNKDDMIRFLNENPDFYYLSDVWWDEPNIKDTDIKNSILSPHVAGGMSGEIMEMAYRSAFENIRRFIAGKPENIVRRDEYSYGTGRFAGV